MTSEWKIAIVLAFGIMLGHLMGTQSAHPEVKPIVIDTSNLEAI